MPHAPLLLPELGRSEGAEIADAVARVDLSGAEAIVLASPHGEVTGVYRKPRGDLGAFGVGGIEVVADADEEVSAVLAKEWGQPVVPAPADHGIVVPLRLLAPEVPVVAVAFAEGAAADEGPELGEAVASLGRSIAFVASVNLSPGLGDRSPLPSLEGAAEADAAVLAALEEAPERAEAPPGSCAAPVLAAFGSLFGGRKCDVLAYGHPFGVGYAVAVTR